MSTRIGIDIGGTFTDLVVLEPNGRVARAKVLSTPDDYGAGIASGLERASTGGRFVGSDVRRIMHGTTVATNAVLEGKGARVALITTEGFRDVLEIRRLRMPALYDIRFQKPAPLVPRRLRFEVPERVDFQGEVERALDLEAARAVIDRILAAKVDAIAICLINGYVNGEHEVLLRDLIAAHDASVPVSISSEIVPEIREYERTSTTVVNAYVQPLVRHYLGGLGARLRDRGISRSLTIMQSSGGAMSAEAAAERPIHIIESGPAAGVVGAAELARRLGCPGLLSFDMGGTTAKAALIDNGHFLRVKSLEVGGGINLAGRLLSGGGYHVSAPAIDIAEVGAGGGSIARLDAGGGLRIGPESAGAAPGPACYGLGGTMPCVTDANVVLGFVNPSALAGGSFPVYRELAVAALEAQVARPLGLTLDDAAWGVHRVANATMARALRAVSTERGRDPRDLQLLAFGGNGPVHAVTLARLLDITRILVPPVPGLFSALGMLFPETEHHFVRTHKRRLGTLDPQALEEIFRTLEAGGAAVLVAEGFDVGTHRFDRLIDLRYVGANSELTVPFPDAGDAIAALHDDFSRLHVKHYGYRSDEETIETMNLRVVARAADGVAPVPDRLSFYEDDLQDDLRAVGARTVYFGPEIGRLEVPVRGRSAIGSDWTPGPVLIEEFDSTTVVPPYGCVRRIAWDTLEIELDRHHD